MTHVDRETLVGRRCAFTLFVGLLIAMTTRPALAEPATPPSVEAEAALAEDVTLLGAAGTEAGDVILVAAGGLYFLSFYGTAGLRVGLGAGFYTELRYEALMLLGQAGTMFVGWGTEVAPDISLGLSVRTAYSTLTLADGLFGMDFLYFELGNDWTAGADLALTWTRAGAANLSFLLGFDMTVGGPRSVSFETREFMYDPEFRSVNAGVMGEWPLSESLHVFVRFDMLLPVATEIIPLGFFPSSAGGVAWRI